MQKVVITFQDGEVIKLTDVTLEIGIGGAQVRESDTEWSYIPFASNVRYIDVKEED
jgi:hypothetical protein